MYDIFIRFIADWLVIPIVLVGGLVMITLPRKMWREYWFKAVLTGLLALLLAKFASLFYQSERPFVELGVQAKAAYLPNPGFPSDHALLITTVTLVVWATTKKVWLSLLLAALCVVVMVGRVVALVHTPADVIGGLACSLIAATIVYRKSLFTLKNKPLSPTKRP